VNRLFRGDASQIYRQLRSEFLTSLLGGLLAVGLSFGGGFTILYLRETRDSSLLGAKQQRLFGAATAGDLKEIEAVLKTGMSPDYPDRNERTALMNAINSETTTFLLAHGANANAESVEGERAIFNAIERQDPESVETLLAAGADPNAFHRSRKVRPLDLALERGDEKISKLLQKHGARETGRGTSSIR
jgi:ankyrin repeat protein